MTIVVTRLPFGASLGRHIFAPAALLSERTVRHEYGRTMPGYKHALFHLLFEGVAFLVQLTASVIFPSLAENYCDRWPENEPNEPGGVR